MMFLASLIVLAGCVALTFHYWNALVLEGDRRLIRRWLLEWGGKGLALPIVIWILCNLGSRPVLPPMVQSVALGRAGGVVGRLFALTGPAILVISTYWTGVSFGWLLANLFRRPGQARDLLILSLIWAFFMILPASLVFMAGGWLSSGVVMLVFLFPIVHSALSLLPDKQAAPIYGQATAKMKFGKYAEAEKAVIAELEKFEDDFDGWMMLADLYANHFHDLAEAELTVYELVGHPATTPGQLAVAFHRLADWHLKLRDNPEAARRVLREIISRLPGTHLARMAQLRINQLPADAGVMAAKRKISGVRLPVLNEQAVEPPAARASLVVSESEAAAHANEWVRKLEKDPNDIPARENLARVLAEEAGQPVAGIEQIELLLALPDQPDRKLAGWLEVIAGWHINQRRDWDAAREILLRIVSNYPQTPAAFTAQRRLLLREAETKLRRPASRSRSPAPSRTEAPSTTPRLHVRGAQPSG